MSSEKIFYTRLEEPNKLKAVIELVGGEVSGISDGSEINYLSGQTPPTEAEIDTELKRLQDEYDAQEYARNRAEEYPSIADLTIALYDEDDKAAIETKRAAVKTKWPKDNSGPVKSED